MSYLVSNWSKHQWEQYGSKYCAAGEPPRPEPTFNYEYINDYYSNQGRASLLLDKANQVAVIQFRGTYYGANVINDLCLCPEGIYGICTKPLEEKFNHMKIHTGFINEYRALKKEFSSLYGRIEAKYQAGWYILITGHSLGGALATLCTIDILLNMTAIKSNRVALITYGSPRVGNKEFAGWIDRAELKMNIRVEVEGDVIVSLPDQSFGAYVHRGELIQIKCTRSGYEVSPNNHNCGEIVPVEVPWLDNALTRGITSVVNWTGNILWGCAKALITLDHRHIPIYRLLAPDGTHSSGSYRNCKRLPESPTNNISTTYTSSTYYNRNSNFSKRIILVECDIGWGNYLFIRNSLDWSKGMIMTCIGKQWKWETDHSPNSNFSFKVLINNLNWEAGGNHPCNHNYNDSYREYRYQANFK